MYVTDDGPGVPAEDWETVFQAFVRASGAAGAAPGSGCTLLVA